MRNDWDTLVLRLRVTGTLVTRVSTESVVEGTVERVTFESSSSGFRVIKVAVPGRSEWLAVVGTFPPMHVGARVRVHGRLETDRKHGEQLRAESLIELAPDTLAGLEKYLASGLVRGVGPKLAQRIVAAFGLDALRVLEEEPGRLAGVEGLGGKRMNAISRAWRDQRELREVMIFLQAHGSSPSLALRIVRRYGTDAMSVVARAPYRLALDVRGVGFKTADRIAATLGVAADSPERMQAGVLQVVHDLAESGHVWTADREVVERSAQMLALDENDSEVQRRLRGALDALTAARRIAIEHVVSGDTGWVVYSSELYAAEVRLAQRLAQIARGPERAIEGISATLASFEQRAGIELVGEQRAAVIEAARRRLLVITGGPGVGKTTIVRAIVALFVGAGMHVKLAAPTGRAAKRMSEATGSEATTLHRLLEFEPKSSSFKRDRRRTVEAGAVIVDEASMLDLSLADALADAIAPGTTLVLVGDVDQLPSVGPGAVLRDVISSAAVPCVRLRQIFRQAARSLIVRNAHRINDGETPLSPSEAGSEVSDFFVIERRDPDRTRETIVDLLAARIPHRFGLDPVRDIQVLTPMNRGPAGAVALNQALQTALNPSGPSLVRGARTYRVGDKVMQLRNDYDKAVFNGDVGIVSSIEPADGTITVRFDERDVAFETTDLDDLVLAYACTVHKSQGSEYPAVVVPLLMGHFVMLSRNLLYTAVTRGKRLVVVVADPRALELALSRRCDGERRTRLAARLAHFTGVDAVDGRGR